jgi:ATP-dependent Lon protease
MPKDLEPAPSFEYLPIFPLPLVMLPREIIPLHIFEERYRQMLRDIAHTGQRFGISRMERATSADDRPPIGSVGCVAEIKESELLPDGRSNIITAGVVRYRIDEYIETGDPYLVARVTTFEDDSHSNDIDELADVVFRQFERMARAAFKMSGSRGEQPEIERTEPEAMSFLISAAFNLDNDLKYALLETTSTKERLLRLKQILDEAVPKMEESADISALSRENGHSKKKLDF